jgi:hypothetical protein
MYFKNGALNELEDEIAQLREQLIEAAWQVSGRLTPGDIVLNMVESVNAPSHRPADPILLRTIAP